MANSKKFEKGPPLFLIHRSARATGHTCSAYAKRTTCYSRIPPPGARSLTRFQKGFTSAVQYGDLRSISKMKFCDLTHPTPLYIPTFRRHRGVSKKHPISRIFSMEKKVIFCTEVGNRISREKAGGVVAFLGSGFAVPKKTCRFDRNFGDWKPDLEPGSNPVPGKMLGELCDLTTPR